MDPSELLDALYYQVVLAAPDEASARVGLERIIADVAVLRDTLRPLRPGWRG